MTDPADISTLLLWTNEKLGINYRAIESDFAHFSFDPRELPALLFAGHNKFTLYRSDPPEAGPLRAGRRHDHRRRLLRVERFRRSFRREMEVHLPRPAASEDAARGAGLLLLLQAGRLHLQEGGRLDLRTPSPAWKAIDFGCRTGVVFSPADMTCGWDGHEHPRGMRVVIDQARQVGRT